jgi:hypothetical protein
LALSIVFALVKNIYSKFGMCRKGNPEIIVPNL